MKKKRQHKVRYILLSVFILSVLSAMIFMRLGGFSTGNAADIPEFEQYAQSVGALSIPENSRIIALGEATHGNKEFQQLKLDVFKKMVEDYDIRAFALEGDSGGCEQVNRYIHGGEGTAQEAAAAIGFAIYRTEEMADLISYLREYNSSASAGDDIRFYGFDMQRISYTHQFLLEDCAELHIDTTELGQLVTGETLNPAYDFSAQKEILTQIKSELKRCGASDKTMHNADLLLQYCQLQSVSATEGSALRDALMAENVMWILQQEQLRGHERIFITGHNSHVAKWGSYDSMGKILSKDVQNGYYAIGTDFYRTRCNLPTGASDKRTEQVFYSHDPLAKAAKRAGYDICWLDFGKIPETSHLGKQIFEYTNMGTLGERYSTLMRLLPPSYRIFQPPAVLYDSMIFVSDASPTKIVGEESTIN